MRLIGHVTIGLVSSALQVDFLDVGKFDIFVSLPPPLLSPNLLLLATSIDNCKTINVWLIQIIKIYGLTILVKP